MLLIAGSVVEHIYGTAFAVRYVYTAPWTIALWTLATVSGLAYLVTIFRTKGWENLFTFLLHFSFVVILAGAMITHVWGVQGELHLRSDKAQTVHSESSVSVFLWDFQVVYAADGETPVDYITELRLLDRSSEETAIDEGTIRMNKPLRFHGYRFCQSDYDSDLNGVVLAYSYDPWGTGVTYAGYALLLLSIIGFFFQRGTYFRVLWRELIDRSPRAGKVGVGVLAAVIIVLAWVMTKVVTPKPPLLPVLQTPLLGIHVAVIMMAYSVIKEFRSLKAMVKDDKTINAIYRDNKHVNAMHKAEMEKIDELTEQLRALAVSNSQLAQKLQQFIDENKED